MNIQFCYYGSALSLLTTILAGSSASQSFGQAVAPTPDNVAEAWHRHPRALVLDALLESRVRVLLTVLLLSLGSIVQGSEIHVAARQGDIAKVINLLQQNASLVEDISTDDHSTPLHEAARSGNIEVARVLLSAKANVNAKTSTGLTPLKLAKGYGKEEMALFLQAKGAELLESAPTFHEPKFSPAQINARASMPWYSSLLQGTKELRIMNNSKALLSVRVLCGGAGADVYIASGSSQSVSVPEGDIKLFYIFSDNPSVLYKGDDLIMPLNAISASIEIGTANGNYRLRQVN